MARPIKETPILKGKDVKRFLENMLNAINNPAPKEEIARMKKSYDALKSIEVNYNLLVTNKKA